MRSDEQLADAAKGGSEAAFVELVLRYQERLLRFLMTRCRSRADAEDALQDTFINAYRYIDSFNPSWRFSTWIYRIGIRNAMRVAVPTADAGIELADSDADPLRDCILASDRENLWLTARRMLPADVYTTLWLRYIEDMSIREIAAAMERSVSWTKVTLHRARNRLSEALRNEVADGAEGEAYG